MNKNKMGCWSTLSVLKLILAIGLFTISIIGTVGVKASPDVDTILLWLVVDVVAVVFATTLLVLQIIKVAKTKCPTCILMLVVIILIFIDCVIWLTISCHDYSSNTLLTSTAWANLESIQNGLRPLLIACTSITLLVSLKNLLKPSTAK
ncbi:MAG: hypothetical protein LBS76_03150 [Mycoplasmataceae bacterium]|jgi:hypothetical protein|nr:hypothetical protein [Mycoplasmataceae bacterium]